MWFVFWLGVGFVAGALALLLFEFWWFSSPGGRNADGHGATAVPMQFGAQFFPFRIPYDLKQLLISPGCEDKLKKKETCVAFNLLVQFLYQEVREAKWVRRWIVKKLQMEFNELLSRTAAGKLLQDITLRNFSVGTQFPVVKDIQVGRVTLGPDKDSFQDLDLTMDIDYRGGFEAAVDVVALLGRRASLAVKVTRLAGKARLQLTRTPYSHWSFSFTHEPIMDFKVQSEFRGRPLPQLVPLIINQFRRTVRKKHVLPAYKVRYRPFFVNPLLQPSADPADYGHIQPKGVVRVTIIKCTRLNLIGLIPLHRQNSGELYCTISAGFKPSNFSFQRRGDSSSAQNHQTSSLFGGGENYVSIALRYVRHSSLDPFGLVMGKEYIAEKVNKMAVVMGVVEKSAADRAGFKVGDLIIAVNNVGITTEKQAAKLMSNTVGEMVVLVERRLTNIDNDEDVTEQLSNNLGMPSVPNLKVELKADDDFLHVSYADDTEKSDEQRKPLRRPISDANLTQLDSASAAKFEDLGNPTFVLQGDNDSNKQHEREEDEENPDLESSGSHKVHSATVLIPKSKTAASSDSGGSYSPPSNVLNLNSAFPDRQDDKKDTDEASGGGGSSASASPSLTRKQKLAAKATEKVAQVAQKWTTGKATVKDIWDRRQKRKVSEENTKDSSTVAMTNSKSEEAELKLRVTTDANGVSTSRLSPEMGSPRPRSRSHSEPDTSILAVSAGQDKASKSSHEKPVVEPTEEKEKVGKKEGLPDSVGKKDIDLKSEAKKPPTIFQTKPVPYIVEPTWYQNFPMPLDDKTRYLNVMVYWRDSADKPVADDPSLHSTAGSSTTLNETNNNSSQQQLKIPKTPAKEPQQPQSPILLGYASIFIPEALDDCNITKSLCHQQIYALRPPSIAIKLPTATEKLMLHPGFDARLCYGDITLGFQWLPDEEHSIIIDDTTAAADDRQQAEGTPVKSGDAADGKKAGKKAADTESLSEFIISDGHKWQATHFQQSTTCNVCQKKIWLKSAYQCLHCGTVSHKKCVLRAASALGQCGQIHEAVGFDDMDKFAHSDTTKDSGDIDSQSMAEMAAEAIESGLDVSGFEGDFSEIERSTSPAGSATVRKSYGTALTERLAGLRRRRGRPASKVPQPTAPASLENLMDVHWGAAEDSSPFHSLLYTKGDTYNEHMISAAKDLGKDLYTNLPVAERKARINEEIDRLRAEIDQTTEQQMELKKKQTKNDKGTAAELLNLDDKLQALAILMLHYCSGLQYCLDLEEAAAGTSMDVSSVGDTSNEPGILVREPSLNDRTDPQHENDNETIEGLIKNEPAPGGDVVADAETVFTMETSGIDRGE